MKILLISDSHHNIANLEKIFTKFAVDCDILIHCGDVNDEETVDYIVNNFKKEIYLVWGNCDLDLEYIDWDLKYPKDKKRLHFYKEKGLFKIKDYNIGISHYPEIAKKMQFENDFTIYGHSHKPAMQELNNKNWLINPGNVAGMYFPATFVIWDLETTFFKLYRLDQLK